MKKFLFGLLFILLTSFAFPKTITAQACYISAFCQPPQIYCFLPSGEQYCCYTLTECDKLKASPFPSPTNATVVNCAEDKTGINTAIGCIRVLDTPEAFLADILRWAVGIGGGIAFLLILYAGFMIMTASGNPERLKAGQELLTSAISGLILLIFSVFILKFIGVDILRLCNFGFGGKCPK